MACTSISAVSYTHLEIASGNMRVYKDGQIVDPMDLAGYLFD